jgi:hypothetical protein
VAALGMELGVVPALWVALQAGWARGALAGGAGPGMGGSQRPGLDAGGPVRQNAGLRPGDGAARERA